MTIISKRIRSYLGIASGMLAVGAGAPVWLWILFLFCKKLSIWIARLAQPQMLPRDPMCFDSQYDFSAFWPAGVLARLHDYAGLYDPAAFLAWRQAHLCANAQPVAWYYPPPTLLPAMLVSHLPLKLGLLVWVAALTLLAALLLRWARLPWSVIICGLLSPAAIYCNELAQLGVIAGALWVAGLMRLDTNPAGAGACFALMLLKPQEALLAPNRGVVATKFAWLYRGGAAGGADPGRQRSAIGMVSLRGVLALGAGIHARGIARAGGSAFAP